MGISEQYVNGLEIKIAEMQQQLEQSFKAAEFMKQQYENRIEELVEDLRSANAVIDVLRTTESETHKVQAARIAELEEIVMSVQGTANWEINALEKHNLEARIAELEKTVAKFEEDSIFLDALRQAGVDNWGGYGEACDLVDEWSKEE